MPHDQLQTTEDTSITADRMILAFSGWMDGGEVSTGTVNRLVELLKADRIGHLDPEGFYIYHLPGSMEVASLFRPHIKIEDGMMQDYDQPENVFYADQGNNLVLFVGKEPNMRWRDFGDCIFAEARRRGVNTILFCGSFGGAVPHTRQPRLYVTVSDMKMLDEYTQFGLRPSEYEGPGSFTLYLLSRAREEGMDMASIVAEIPGYLQGINPASIEAVTRRLAKILSLDLDLHQLRTASTKWEIKVSEAVEKDDDLAEKVQELEEQYDDELIDVDSGGQ